MIQKYTEIFTKDLMVE